MDMMRESRKARGSRVARFALPVVLACAWMVSGAAFAQTPAAEKAPVAPEQWTQNFPEALRLAQAQRRPLVIYGSSHDCPHCQRMQAALSRDEFQSWVKGSGLYLVKTYYDQTNSVPVQEQAAKFLDTLPNPQPRVYPTVGIYWPKSSNEVLRTAFPARRGKMPGEANALLLGEFLNAMDRLLADYFASIGGHPRMVLRPVEVGRDAPKLIRVAVDGPGTAEMTPKSGELFRGKKVVLKATAAPGMTFRGWLCPDGKMRKPRYGRGFSLGFAMPAGTYTAVFAKP